MAGPDTGADVLLSPVEGRETAQSEATTSTSPSSPSRAAAQSLRPEDTEPGQAQALTELRPPAKSKGKAKVRGACMHAATLALLPGTSSVIA